MNLPVNFLILLQTQELLHEYCFELLVAASDDEKKEIFD